MNSHTNFLPQHLSQNRDRRLNLFSSYPNFSIEIDRSIKRSKLFYVDSTTRGVLDQLNSIVNTNYVHRKKAEYIVSKLIRQEKRLEKIIEENKNLKKEIVKLNSILKLLRISTSKSYRELYLKNGNEVNKK